MSRRSYLALKSQRKGKAGEDLAEQMMRCCGIRQVEKIATPIVMYDRQPSGHVRVKFVGKVSGDRRGILPPNGRRVLAEVKTRTNGNLQWSAFEQHQIDALQENHDCGGLSLVIWINGQQNVILEWPIPGFDRPRTSVTLERAIELDWYGKQ